MKPKPAASNQERKNSMEVTFGKNETEIPSPKPVQAVKSIVEPAIDVQASVTPEEMPVDAAKLAKALFQMPVAPGVQEEIIKTLVPPDAPPAEEKAPVQTNAPTQALACRTAPVLGDYIPDFNDIILPRINIVQNIGTLKESFSPGEVTFGQSVVLFTPPRINAKTGNVESAGTKPMVMTVIGFKMPIRFVEKVIGGIRGLIVNSEDEVRLAGGTLDYNEWNLKKAQGMKRFEPLAEALVAIERPEHCPNNGTTFVYTVNDKQYAFAWWAMKGTSYTEAAKRVFFTARRTGCLIKGYPSFSYNVSVTEKGYPNGNRAWIPVCLPREQSTPEFISLVKDFLNPTPVENSPSGE